MLISVVYEEDGRECLNLLMADDRISAGAKLYRNTRKVHGTNIFRGFFLKRYRPPCIS